ncbi:SusD/RagB family nutrient-binding outer membrane lipoprotein [Chitinophaga solisilvae]|uniref:SusD/RagB family nutrient-binding outer membrane lipoprotein n=1 Tax=Chitinophaga solisilvae TaxID=1233460 RepID=UPI00137187C0|nr:SusD/RagB family nutrient-binding outer membrane lipoprotein [Chitinophaga solisilvae]
MKKIQAMILFLGCTVMGSSCKKFLDINTDPNNPLSVKEAQILPQVIVTTSTTVTGGTTANIIAYWMQQLSLNQPYPSLESYTITPVDVDNTWNYYLYPNIFQNLTIMINQATQAHHYGYAAIGKTLYAYNLAIASDLWGNVIYSQGFKIPEIMQPAYDKQEAVYGTIQQMLDSALYFMDQPVSKVKPEQEDYIYGGDMDQWRKFAWTLKARYYLRLTKAPGHTAAAQADKALEALKKGFGSNSDNALVAYPGGGAAENPWYMNTGDASGGVVMGQSFIDSLVSRKDPRLSVLATIGNKGNYAGRRVGDVPAPDPDSFSLVNNFYAGKSASLYLATYAEALFIKAEATLIKQGAAAASPVYLDAIAAHMNMLGIAANAQQTYRNARPALTTENALNQIITEKYVANFLSPETYNDWRRTGFPVLKPYQDEIVKAIPRRWPYPANELLTNPQPDQKVSVNDRLWWDGN